MNLSFQRSRPALALLLAAGLAAQTAACTSEPARRSAPSGENSVRVAIDDSGISQRVVTQVYFEKLAESGRDAIPIVVKSSTSVGGTFGALSRGEVDLMVGCAGDLLYQLNPLLALELAAEWKNSAGGAPSPAQLDALYQAVVNNLPGGLAATDPSNAQGCTGQEPQVDLPQYLIPIYRKPMFPRRDRLTLNEVSGTLSSADVLELTDQVTTEGVIAPVVRQYMGRVGL